MREGGTMEERENKGGKDWERGKEDLGRQGARGGRRVSKDGREGGGVKVETRG